MTDSQPITRKRGDTFRIRIVFSQDDGTPLPLEGTFVLVVTQQSAPGPADVPVMSLLGTIFSNGLNGELAIVDFYQTDVQADHVGEYFYEVENTTLDGRRRTILDGPFTMTQDRAKGNPGLRWEADGEDGVRVDLLGADFWTGYLSNVYSEIDLEYATADGRKIIELVGANDFSKVYISPNGALSTMPTFPPNGHSGIYDLTFEFYAYESPGEIRLHLMLGGFASGDTSCEVFMDDNPLPYYAQLWGPNNEDSWEANNAANPITWVGWTSFRIRQDFETLEYWVRAWDGLLADEPDTWLFNGQIDDPAAVLWFQGATQLRLQRTTAVGARLGLHSFTWERIG